MAIYTSPLRRARETAEALRGALGVDVHVERDLADLDYGRWTGRTPAEVEGSEPATYRRFREEPETVTVPGGESVRAVADRVERVLLRIAREPAGGPLAAVTHDVPIQLVVARASGRLGAEVWARAFPTGSITTVVVQDGAVAVEDGPAPG